MLEDLYDASTGIFVTFTSLYYNPVGIFVWDVWDVWDVMICMGCQECLRHKLCGMFGIFIV